VLFKVSKCNESKARKHVDNIYSIVLNLVIVLAVNLGPVKNFALDMFWWIAFNQLSIWLLKNLFHETLEFFTEFLKNN